METIISVRAQGTKRALKRPRVDEVGIQERATSFTKRSIKADAKLQALQQIIRLMDLTTLEGADTPGKVRQLCARARHPVSPLLHAELAHLPRYCEIPAVAAVCVYPNFVRLAKTALEGTGIGIASVATAFPSGQVPLKAKLDDVKLAIASGATEIDMVIARGAFLSGNYQKVVEEIEAVKALCGETVHLKVILETGELGSLDNIRLASDLAIQAGADFIKTSTGKIQPAATMPVTLVMLQAIADHFGETGKRIGMKPAGGIRSAKEAIHYLVMVQETLGPEWLGPELFRFGASTLLNDVLRQIYKEITGRYFYDKAFASD